MSNFTEQLLESKALGTNKPTKKAFFNTCSCTAVFDEAHHEKPGMSLHGCNEAARVRITFMSTGGNLCNIFMIDVKLPWRVVERVHISPTGAEWLHRDNNPSKTKFTAMITCISCVLTCKIMAVQILSRQSMRPWGSLRIVSQTLRVSGRQNSWDSKSVIQRNA